MRLAPRRNLRTNPSSLDCQVRILRALTALHELNGGFLLGHVTKEGFSTLDEIFHNKSVDQLWGQIKPSACGDRRA